MNTFLTALKEACLKQPVAEKWLLTPNLRVARQWLDALTLAQTGAAQPAPLLNLRPKTLKAAAMEWSGAEQGALNSSAGEFLAARVWAAHEQELLYFKDQTAGPGLYRLLFQAWQDLRLAGVSPEELRAEHFDEARKAADLQKLYRGYLSELRTHQLPDYAMLLELARTQLASKKFEWPADLHILIPEDLELSACESALLEALPAGTFTKLPVRTAEQESAAPQKTRLEYSSAAGATCEVRAVFRTCLERGWPLDQIEILFTDYEYALRLQEEAERLLGRNHNVLTFADGLPLRLTRPGRALLGWLEWLRTDLTQETLVELLEARLLKLAPPCAKADAEELSTARLAQTLRGLRVRKDPQRKLYLQKSKAALERVRRRFFSMAQPAAAASSAAGPLDRLDDEAGRIHVAELAPAEKARRLAEWKREEHALTCLCELLELLLKGAPQKTDRPAEWLRLARNFIEHTARRDPDDLEDNYAREKLLEDVDAQQELIARFGAPPGFRAVDWLQDLAQQARISGSAPRSGAAHCASLSGGGHAGRPHLFVLGLDDTRFPGHAAQDPLLLDGERKKISAQLPLATQFQIKLRNRFELLQEQHCGTLALSHAQFDSAMDRELFPATPFHAREESNPLLEQVLAPRQAAQCLDETEWWLWRCADKNNPPYLPINQAKLRYTHLADGDEARQAREDKTFSVYDGLLIPPDSELDPFNLKDGPVLSAGRLETLGVCPLRYFYKYVLELEPLDETSADPAQWLDALERGSLMHSLFERALGLHPQGLAATAQEQFQKVQQVLREQLQRTALESPPPGQAAQKSEEHWQEQALRILLAEEAAAASRAPKNRPLAFEVSIGLPASATPTPFDQSRPLEISVTPEHSIRVRGKIDRIDLVDGESGKTLALWDYKSGSSSRFEKKHFESGRQLQFWFYRELVKKLDLLWKECGATRAPEFGYYFPQVKGRGERIQKEWDEFNAATTVATLCQLARHGTLPATTDSDDCRYCDFSALCGPNVEQVTQKSLEKCAETKLAHLNDFLSLRKSIKEKNATENPLPSAAGTRRKKKKAGPGS